MRHGSRGLGVALAVLLATSAGRAADDFKDLLSRVPESANAIVLIDVEALVKSPLGGMEGWAQKHQSEYLAGAMMLPPSASKAVIASQLGSGNPAGDWVVALIPTKRNVDMKQVAKDEQGELESLSGMSAVHSRRNAYFVEMGPKLLGVMSPANRQEVSRWLRTAKAGRPVELSPYLKDSIDWPRNGQVLMAIDLEDMLNPRAVRNWCQHCKKLGGDAANIDKAVKLIGKLRGIKFMARVTDKIQGQLILDFSDKIDLKDAAVLKPVLQEGLIELGAPLEEVTGGKSSVEGRSLIIDAEISDKVLRRIMSVIHTPAPSAGVVGDSGPTPSEDPALYASKRYFASVQSLLDELKEMNRRAYHSGMIVQWYETYGRKIDQLPMVDVDKELLQYGGSVSNKLRSLSASLNGANIQSNVLDSYKRTNVYASGGGYYGNRYTGYGYSRGSFWAESNAADIGSMKAEVVGKGRENRQEIWNSIDQDTAEVRKAMTEKYKAEFPVGN